MTDTQGIEGLLDRLQGVRQLGDSQWSAQCPAHEDRRNSLSIGLGEGGKMLLHCHAGCTFDSVLRAAHTELSQSMSKPSASRSREVISTYDYRDEEGRLLYQVQRFMPKDFRQRRPDGEGGWLYKLNGVRRVPFRLPELLAADPSLPVFLTEGEQDVLRLERLGLIATCNAGGAGKWLPEFSPFLKGRNVALLPDNDEPGRKHASQVIRSLADFSQSATIVELPNLPPKGDVSDWLDAGGSREELLELVSELQGREPVEVPDIQFAEGRTDMANALRLLREHGRDILYCPTWKKFLVWSGAYWTEDSSLTAERFAQSVADKLWDEVAELGRSGGEIKRPLSFATRSSSNQGIQAMQGLVRTHVAVQPQEFDTDPWLFNVVNGTLDLRNGELRPHRRLDRITKKAGTVFDPQADCPTWNTFLETSLPNAAIREYLQRHTGMCLTGVVRDHVLVVEYGMGSNGKSVQVNTMLSLFGDYGAKAPAELLLAKRSDDHPTIKASLFGMRYVACVEADEGRRLAEAQVKELTGGDRITARRMREDFWSFEPTHKLVLVTNHKPMVQSNDHGIWRRLKVIPFEVEIPDDKQDHQLTEKLAAELPGILNWALQGCLAWQQTGLQPPEEVALATEGYRNDMDVVGEFIAERCVVGPDYHVAASELYSAYRAHCESRGERPMSNRRFGSQLNERRFDKTRRKSGIVRCGVGLVAGSVETEWV